MGDFSYRAVDKSGETISGIMAAPDIDSLEVKLQEISCVLIEASEDRPSMTKVRSFRRGKVKRREIIEFSFQMSALMQSGVMILDALNTISEDTKSPALSYVLDDIKRNVEAGYLFHEGMARHKTVFSNQILSMVKAGEESGSLVETFKEIANYLEWMENLIGEIKRATIYPIMVSIALAAFITILFTFVVPKFIEILVAVNVPLPLPTKVIMWVSEVFVNWWWLLIGLGVIVPIAVRYMKKNSVAFLNNWDKMKINLPVFGELNRMFAMTRFSQTFSTLFRSGIPAITNLQLCQPVVGNKIYEGTLIECEAEMLEGIMMSDSLRKHYFYSPLIIRMLAVGEASGDLGAALDNVSRYYNEEIPRQVKKLFAIIEPSIILILIVIVGFTALAIFMPILSLMGAMQQ